MFDLEKRRKELGLTLEQERNKQDDEIIGIRIKTRREEIGMTQEELGNSLGLNKSTIQRYETGKIKNIKLPILQAMAKQLCVNSDWLALKTDKKEKHLTFEEKAVLKAYQEHPELQHSVKLLLGLEKIEK